jgi:hypothetical protein
MALSGGGRGLLRGLAFAGVAAAGYVFGVTSDRAAAQPAQPAQPPMGGQPQPKGQPPLPTTDHRVVAYITNPTTNTLIEITREDLGEFLIARGGYEKLDLLVNKKIIETEAARRGIVVTTVEIKAGLEEDLRGLGISIKDFEKHVLPRYHKNLYEWVEDVIKPRLMLSKMCQDRVKVTEQDLMKLYENKYGERRQAKVICWNRDDLRTAQRQWDEARKGDADFDRIARTQTEPALASSCGLVAPIGRYTEAQDEKVEQMLFSLREGEVSQLFDTPSGIMCVKLVAILPSQKEKMPLDEKLRTTLTNEMRAKRLEQEIGKFFQEIKKVAQPNVLLKGPPSAAEFREGVGQIINNANLQPAGGSHPMPPGAVRP